MKSHVSCCMGRSSDAMRMNRSSKKTMGVGALHSFFVRLVKEGRMQLAALRSMLIVGGSSGGGSSASGAGALSLLFAEASPGRAGPQQEANPMRKTKDTLMKKYNFKTLLKYGLLGGALAFSSCGEDEPSELLTTEYVFGVDYIDEIKTTTNIAKDGQNPRVGKIKILSDGQSCRGGPSYVLLKYLDPAFVAANGKGTGDNSVINGVEFERNPDRTKTAAGLADSLKLARDYKYKIENAR